jgi:hypothetical protein
MACICEIVHLDYEIYWRFNGLLVVSSIYIDNEGNLLDMGRCSQIDSWTFEWKYRSCKVVYTRDH